MFGLDLGRKCGSVVVTGVYADCMSRLAVCGISKLAHGQELKLNIKLEILFIV